MWTNITVALEIFYGNLNPTKVCLFILLFYVIDKRLMTFIYLIVLIYY